MTLFGAFDWHSFFFMLFAALAGSVLFSRATPLAARLLYPLSRTERAATVYRASASECAAFAQRHLATVVTRRGR